MKIPPLIMLSMLSSAQAGCRWHSPVWKQSLDSAPEVNISSERIVTVSWGLDQFQERPECVDKFEVGVRSLEGGEERKLCSLPYQAGQQVYQCKLDLSKDKYCSNKFGFWVIGVNINHNRGVERVQTFADTIVTVMCGQGEEEPLPTKERVRSASCLALTPAWTSSPLIQQTGRTELRISWDIRQLSSSHCISFFLLKYWHSSDFVPKQTTLKFIAGEQRKYEGVMKVMACTTYTYLLTTAFSASKSSDIQGDIKIPCEGENFLEPIGFKFIPEDDDQIHAETLGQNEEREEGKVIGVELEVKKNRFRPPKMIAVDSSPESITWQLSELDPRVKIEKYQVSCWDDVTTNPRRDLPCCQVEEKGQDGGTVANLTVGQLEPNTSYTCQGGMLVEGDWLYSPRALRITQNSGALSCISCCLLVFTLIIGGLSNSI